MWSRSGPNSFICKDQITDSISCMSEHFVTVVEENFLLTAGQSPWTPPAFWLCGCQLCMVLQKQCVAHGQCHLHHPTESEHITDLRSQRSFRVSGSHIRRVRITELTTSCLLTCWTQRVKSMHSPTGFKQRLHRCRHFSSFRLSVNQQGIICQDFASADNLSKTLKWKNLTFSFMKRKLASCFSTLSNLRLYIPKVIQCCLFVSESLRLFLTFKVSSFALKTRWPDLTDLD